MVTALNAVVARRRVAPGRRSAAAPATLCALLVLFSATSARADGVQALIREAIESHPTIRSAQAARSGAYADLATARWQYYPTPSISVEGAAASNDPSRGDKTIQTYRIEQPLWRGGRLDLGVKRGETQVMDRDAAVASTRQQVALGVLQAFGEWYASQLKISAVNDNLEVHRNLQAQIERRIREGLSPRSDLALAVTRLEQVQVELAGYQAQQQVAQSRLAQLIGRAIRQEELRQTLFREIHVPQDVDGLIGQALGRSPSVLRAEAQAETASVDADLVAASRWPSVSAFLEHQEGRTYLGGPRRVLRAGISVQSSFGAGLSLNSSIDSARARARSAEDDVEAARRGVIDQMQADHMQYSATLHRRSALKGALAASLSLRDSYDRQYLAGGKSWMDVMNAARELSQLTVQAGDIESTLLVLGWRLMIQAEGLNALLSAETTATRREQKP